MPFTNMHKHLHKWLINITHVFSVGNLAFAINIMFSFVI